MIPNPIHRALSVMRRHGVQHLLMGGQACIIYGAAEFSRDADLAILADPDNLTRITAAVAELHAQVVAVPLFEAGYLERGHAVHFRCQREDVRGLRIDLMSRMRGVAPFSELWLRRTTVTVRDPAGSPLDLEVMGLPDLVASKKTQRDKDWPMIRRLVEANYFELRDAPNPARVEFWLRELRTAGLLVEAVGRFPEGAAQAAEMRPVVGAARAGDLNGIERELAAEQAVEGERDRSYWQPLREELERLRRAQRMNEPPNKHS